MVCNATFFPLLHSDCIGMQMGSRRYNDAAWKRVRLMVLARDGHTCQIKGANCGGVANQVDHIVPITRGGAYLDPANLRASCRRCNVSRANRGRNRDGWQRSSTHVVLVVGPPGAGKSTLVDAEATDRDVVIDYDAILGALGPAVPRGSGQRHDVAMAARNAVLNKVRAGEVDAERVWIISTNPAAEGMFPHHEVRVVDPGRDVVLAQAAAAGRPTSFAAVIDDWYVRRAGGVSAPSRSW